MGTRHTKQGIEGRVDLSTAGSQNSLDNRNVDARECFLQNILGLLVLGRRSRGLRRGGLGGRCRRCHVGGVGCGGGRGGVGLMVVFTAENSSLLDVFVVAEIQGFNCSGRLGSTGRGVLVLKSQQR